MLRKNSGRIHAGYKGAYEKHLDKQKQRVAALREVENQGEQQEFEETELWAVTCGGCELHHDDRILSSQFIEVYVYASERQASQDLQ